MNIIYKKETLFFIIFTLILLTFTIWRDYNLLFQTPVVTGIDGYYYVLQISSLGNEGQLYFPTYTPVTIYLLTALSYITQDIVSAIKFGGIFLHILLGIGVMYLVSAVTKNIWSGFIGLLIVMISNLHLFFISEFLNNLSALVFVVWAAFCLLKFLQTRKRGWIIILGLLLLIAIFSHRSTIGLIFLIIVTTSLAYLLTGDGINKKYRVLGLIAVITLFILPLIIAWQPFFSLPRWLALEVLKIPHVPFNRTTLTEGLMLLFIVFFVLILRLCFSRLFQPKASVLLLVSIILWVMLLNLNPFLNHATGFGGIVGRLGSLSYLQAAIATPILISLLFSVSRIFAIVGTPIFALLLVVSYLAPFPPGLRTEYLQNREKLVRELPELKKQLCPMPFIVAQHGDQFVVTAVTGIPSQQKPPEAQTSRCVYWLIHQTDILQLLSNDEINVGYKSDFILIEDKVLADKLNFLTSAERRKLFAANPHLRI